MVLEALLLAAGMSGCVHLALMSYVDSVGEIDGPDDEDEALPMEIPTDLEGAARSSLEAVQCAEP